MNQEKKCGKDRCNRPDANQFSVLQSILKMGPSRDDPQGMYTGRPIEPGETPVQDSDDL